MTRSYSYYAVIESDGSFGAYFPDFPGSGSVGNTLEELRQSLKSCLVSLIQGYYQDGLDIPAPSSPDLFNITNNESVELITIKYRVPLKRGGARVGSGRPKTGRKANNTVSIYLTQSESDTLNQLAKAYKTSKTGFLRSYILSEAKRLNLT